MNSVDGFVNTYEVGTLSLTVSYQESLSSLVSPLSNHHGSLLVPHLDLSRSLLHGRLLTRVGPTVSPDIDPVYLGTDFVIVTLRFDWRGETPRRDGGRGRGSPLGPSLFASTCNLTDTLTGV